MAQGIPQFETRVMGVVGKKTNNYLCLRLKIPPILLKNQNLHRSREAKGKRIHPKQQLVRLVWEIKKYITIIIGALYY